MANLLPQFARKKLIREYWIRLFSVILFMLSFVLLAIMIMFVPTFIFINTETVAMKETVRDAEAEKVRTEEASSIIQRTNRQVDLLRSSQDVRPFTYYFTLLEAVAGPVISVERFSAVREADGSIELIQIQAIAQTRQSLIDFLDELNDHQEFGRVNVPIANLAQSENIRFSVSIPILSEVTDT